MALTNENLDNGGLTGRMQVEVLPTWCHGDTMLASDTVTYRADRMYYYDRSLN